MDSSASLFGEKPLLHACAPASLTLPKLEEVQARLLQPITPSASWLASLKPLSAQSQVVAGSLTTPNALDFKWLDSVLEQTQARQPAASEVKKLVSYSAFSEPRLLWLENSLLKQPAHLAVQGLEESKARLLRPISTCVALSKPLDVQVSPLLDPQERICASTSLGLPPGYTAQDETFGPSTKLEEPQLQEERDEVEAAGAIPEYVLTLPEDDLKVQSEEDDSLADELPVESKEQQVKDQKLMLLSLACCSLVEGPKFGNPPGELQQALMQVCESLAEHDPEFILKVALYTRQELNIRSTANFLLALSARLLPCRPHLRRYFCHTVQLPSDWKEVAKLYQSLAGEGKALAPMPCCLRAAMADKFRQFDMYQLAKYNNRKSQGKRSRRPKPRKQEPRASNWEEHWPGRNTVFATKARLLQRKFEEELKKEKVCPVATKDLFSLKALIQRLHISEPAQLVMSVLGRRYPSDLSAFSRSRLPGPWDSSLAGTRMRLPKPQTWERDLSQLGNKAKAWEELIDADKLPFMAMLRNLRNILRTGVSDRHHMRLLKRLEDKESVIRSRQLPFRFLSAFKVLKDLENELREAETPFPSNKDIILKIIQRHGLNISYGRSSLSWTRRSLRGCLEIPVIFSMVKREKRKLLKAREIRCSHALLQRYQEALEKAIHIAVRHNLPPIPGRTLILIRNSDMSQPYVKAQGLCCPSTNGQDDIGRASLPLTKLDVAMLLGSMVHFASEEAQILFSYEGQEFRPAAMTGSVLTDVQALRDLDAYYNYEEDHRARDVIMDLIARRQKVDRILLLSAEPYVPLLGSALWLYRHHVSPDCLFVNVCANAANPSTSGSRNVVISGFNEQVLRFMAECGNSRFLEHVGKADELHGLPKKRKAVAAEVETGVASLIPPPKSRWRSVKIFVSSTFRDMHGERDLLIRSVFPELRARAAQFCLAIEDIDLRWGITEHESQQNKQLELCLSEVCRSQLFIGILGERYGHVPTEYSLPDEAHFEWVKSYPAGRSITELEVVQFLNGCENPAAPSRSFFYLRQPDFLDSVPETWRADFVAESEEAKRRLGDLKESIENHGSLASCSRYVCQWGGVAQGRPYVKGLEDFGVKVLQDVWECLRRQFIEGDGSTLADDEPEKEEEIGLQDSFQELQQRRFCARAKLVHAVAAQLRGGKLCIVSGEPGQGKTVFLAALSQVLRAKTPLQKEDPDPSYHVVTHFTQARPDQAEAQVMLGHLCAQLRKLLVHPPAPPKSYRGLVGQFDSLLHSVALSLKRRQSLVVLVDGADLTYTAGGQLVSDWLPEELPQRVSLVLSVSEESVLLGSLKRRKDAFSIPLGPLDPPDRVAMVRKDLALYGKKLEESAFNNQMRLVLLKRDSRQPLYLTLLTQDLRLFALYEKLSERIQKLPVSLPLLLQHLLGCLEQDHGEEMVSVALVCLWASRDGLMERDLYTILADLKDLNGTDFTMEHAICVERQARSHPMAPFFDFLRSLRGLLGACGSPAGPSGSRLHLSSAPLRMAVERRYLKNSGLDYTAHMLLAAHWWKLVGLDDSWNQNCEAEALMALPYHMAQSENFEVLGSLLTDLSFVSAHVRLGLLHSLSEAYALYETASDLEVDETVRTFRAFLQRNMRLLSQNPLLLLQQAANEPHGSSLCVQAMNELIENGRPILKWANKPQEAQKTNSLVLSLPATPSCVSIAPSGKLAAVGTADGILHLLDVETGQELKSLLSACDGISACEFLSEVTVCLGAFNGRLELWSLREGCRLMGTDSHKTQITGCCTNAGCKLLATVSLDGHLKLWESTHGQLTHERDCLCPLNCVAFHPEGQLVATGGWDRTVTVLDANEMSVTSVMKGHDASIHSISFSSAGNVLAAGTLMGSVHLWSWQEAVVLKTFSSHSGCVSVALFLPGGELLTAGEDCKVQLWAGHQGQLWSTLRSGVSSPALCTAANPDCSRLAVGHHSGDLKVFIHLWHTPLTHCAATGVAFCSLAWLDSLHLVGGSSDGSLYVTNTSQFSRLCLHKLQGHKGAVTGLAVFEKLVASVSEDFTVQLWLSETLRPTDPAADADILPLAVLRGHTGGVTCCAFSLDGRYLATGGKDRALFLWDVRDPSQKTPSLWRSMLFCHQDWISCCAWAGPMLLTGSNDCTVCLWDPKTGQRLQEFLGHQSPVCSVMSEKEHVFSVGRDGMLVAWNRQGLEMTRFLAHPDRANHCAGFSDPREKEFILAAAGGDGTVKLWKPLKLAEPDVFPGHCAAICGAAASPASSSFLTISKDNTVRVWAVPKEKGAAKDLPTHQGAVTALAWSPDGDFVASGGEHGDLVLWHKAKAVEKVKAGQRCISALAFTSTRTILVAADGISLWYISRQRNGTISLTRKKCLRQAEESSALCVGVLRPSGPIVLGMASGDLLVLQPGAESFQQNPYTDKVWDIQQHVSFDISVSEEEEGHIFHIWDSMHSPTLFKMRVTESGKLEDTDALEKIPWVPKRPSVWVTAARQVKGKLLLCADSEGCLWTQTQQTEERVDKWKPDGWQRKKIHSDKITALHVLGDRIVTASHDRDVKIWDGNTMKLLGQFRCHGPVSQLQPWTDADSTLFLYAGDTLGNIYSLEWGSVSA
ncbi:telomerase protein component 1 isoform X1 [Podarcis lilfordi]|uniref:Telomerase protein component 1 isoform X1 n=1 Tax=Podarcis lilfordi TaxID=74358 RepID=A0AA35L7A8_9SAUR|nr:telomerase protein component 1 isoform X1 [Podarcis lilfordi]